MMNKPLAVSVFALVALAVGACSDDEQPAEPTNVDPGVVVSVEGDSEDTPTT